MHEQLCIYLWDVMCVYVIEQGFEVLYLPPFVLTLAPLTVKKSNEKKERRKIKTISNMKIIK
jgi:hypothetical protein